MALSFDIWCYALPKGSRDSIWKLAFVALALVIWRMKNWIIFHQEFFYDEGCLEIWCFDLAWWIKVE